MWYRFHRGVSATGGPCPRVRSLVGPGPLSQDVTRLDPRWAWPRRRGRSMARRGSGRPVLVGLGGRCPNRRPSEGRRYGHRCYSLLRVFGIFIGGLLRNKYVQNAEQRHVSGASEIKGAYRPPFPQRWDLGPSPPMPPRRASLEPTKTQEDVPGTQVLPLGGAYCNNQPCKGMGRVIPGQHRVLSG